MIIEALRTTPVSGDEVRFTERLDYPAHICGGVVALVLVIVGILSDHKPSAQAVRIVTRYITDLSGSASEGAAQPRGECYRVRCGQGQTAPNRGSRAAGRDIHCARRRGRWRGTAAPDRTEQHIGDG